MRPWHSLPAEVYALVDQTPGTVLLEGAPAKIGDPPEGPNQAGNSNRNEEPWTRLFTAPLRACAAYRPSEVPRLFREIEDATAAGHSAAGFFAYECGACFEPKAQARHNTGVPLAWLGIYERGYAFDRASGQFVDGTPRGLRAGAAAGSAIRSASPAEPELHRGLDAEFALTEAEHARRIARIHEWIRAGDIYQLNFTAPWQLHLAESAAALYGRLRARQPAEYGAFIHWLPDRRILSFSPELFFRIDNGGGGGEGSLRRITTRPMKGTARRGRTTREDCAIAEWLRQDPKNRSENLMIVDLERNDLGRLARFGSVRTEELFAVKRLPTLWQMTSTVTAELRDEIGFEDVFRALFPSGSVTGAPKVRAMQLITELEDGPRGAYTGAIGFFSRQETVFNVAIRTLEIDGGSGKMGVGGGIVIDSVAADEYRECLLKAEFLTGTAHRLAARQFPALKAPLLIETMLWAGVYPLLDLHLDRLADSAEYFDFQYDRAAIQEALHQYARSFPAGARRKVRLLLAWGGALEITDAEIMDAEIMEEPRPALGEAQALERVRMASERTDSSDPMLYHKTTDRPLYAKAHREAVREGFCDVLFRNERGEVTEGAISNIFVVRGGRWMTPPVECGLLAGVFRRHLLETRPEIEERVLSPEDLRSADAVYLANAVRGLRRVEIDWTR